MSTNTSPLIRLHLLSGPCPLHIVKGLSKQSAVTGLFRNIPLLPKLDLFFETKGLGETRQHHFSSNAFALHECIRKALHGYI